MLDIFISTETERVMRSVGRNKTILLIGRDANRHAVNTIKYYDALPKAMHDYGDSELTQAFSVAQEFGASHVFLLNIRNQHDYIDLIDVLKQYDFAYIVPLNIHLSDFFHDANRNGKKIFYGRDYLERASQRNHSLFLMTDRHASLYEDMDQYLDEMKRKAAELHHSIPVHARASNFVFVANNLRKYPMSNVVLASLLAGDEGTYPTLKDTPVVFDIDSFDMGEAEIVYFKRSAGSGTTVENLVNFELNDPLMKSVFVGRIMRYIIRTLDMSELHGRNYTVYQKVRAEKMLETYFDGLKGWLIRDYVIENISFTREGIGVGSIECTVTIWAKSTSEKYSLLLGG